MKKISDLKSLIADDFENSRQSIKKMLIEFGITDIDMVSSGQAVIDSCRVKQYDLILCDYSLGNGKNGQQILDELRFKKYLSEFSLFLIISAETSRDIVMSIMECQPDEYLTKPFTLGVLHKRLERLFKQNETLEEIKINISKNNVKLVIDLCIQHISEDGRYSLWCKKKLVDIYLHEKEYSKVIELCEVVLNEREVDWALVALAKVHISMNEFKEATAILEKIITVFPNNIIAYDLLCDCYKVKGKIDKAQAVISMALKISPLVTQRQDTMMELSIETGDIEHALKAAHQSLKLKHNSIYESSESYLKVANPKFR